MLGAKRSAMARKPGCSAGWASSMRSEMMSLGKLLVAQLGLLGLGQRSGVGIRHLDLPRDSALPERPGDLRRRAARLLQRLHVDVPIGDVLADGATQDQVQLRPATERPCLRGIGQAMRGARRYQARHVLAHAYDGLCVAYFPASGRRPLSRNSSTSAIRFSTSGIQAPIASSSGRKTVAAVPGLDRRT